MVLIGLVSKNFISEKNFEVVELRLQLNEITLNYKKRNCVLFSKNSARNFNLFFITTTNGKIENNDTVNYFVIIMSNKQR